jgi:hypothetical protein
MSFYQEFLDVGFVLDDNTGEFGVSQIGLSLIDRLFKRLVVFVLNVGLEVAENGVRGVEQFELEFLFFDFCLLEEEGADLVGLVVDLHIVLGCLVMRLHFQVKLKV